MNLGKAALFGTFTGFAGAAIWAAIAYFANFEIGWLAWGIGAAVGWATVTGAQQSSKFVGVLAVVITVFALLLGKAATVELVVNNEYGDPEQLVQESIASLNEEVLTSYVADKIVAEREAAGEKIAWPAGVDPAYASTEADYPAEIWDDASQQWLALTEEEKREFRSTIEANIRNNVAVGLGAFQEELRKEGFIQSFGAMDAVFFGLAICTAFSVASSREFGNGSAEDASTPAIV